MAAWIWPSFPTTCVLAVTVVSCGETSVKPEQPSATTAQRRVIAAPLTQSWAVQGELVAERSPTPRRLVIAQQRVYIVDPTAGRVTALRLRDGKMLWTTDGGEGDFHLTQPQDVAVTSSHAVVVADMDRRRLVEFDSGGQPHRTFEGLPPAWGMCAVGNDLLLMTMAVQAPLRLLNTATRDVAKFPMPWAELNTAMAPQTLSVLRSDESGRICILARESGGGFSIWKDGSFGSPHAPVEKRRSGTAAISAMLVGDTAFVLFGGAPPDRDRIVDLYDATGGAYLESWRMPSPLLWLGYGSGTFVAIQVNDGQRSIVAFRRASK